MGRGEGRSWALEVEQDWWLLTEGDNILSGEVARDTDLSLNIVRVSLV